MAKSPWPVHGSAMESSTPDESAAMVHLSPHESSDPLHSALHHSFSLLRSDLTPPFSLRIPDPSHYETLTHALAYAVLSQAHTRVHLAHLHATVLDGYRLFTITLTRITTRLYPSLLPRPRVQIISILSTLIDVAAVGAGDLVVALLRRVESGDFSWQNLWLAGELARVLLEKWKWTVETPGVVPSGVFVFLRLLADNWRLSGGRDLELLKRLEVEFCVRALREEFALCSGIGRDLVRLLQDVVFVPELGDVWRDLLCSPGVFGFGGIGQLCRTRTPSRYFLLRVSVEMETRLRFLLTHVKWGSQTRYLEWFGKKFLCRPEQETVIVDLIRFVCCAHHPSNEIIQSDIYSRWALIGWLLKCCRKNYFEANAKLALFYDWLFFDEKVDNIMNIEPAILLMVHSLPKYAELTNTLMEFLFLLVDNYDPSWNDTISHSVLESFMLLERKGVVPSLLPLTSDVKVAPMLRQRLRTFLSAPKLDAAKTMSTFGNSCAKLLEFHSGIVKDSETSLKASVKESEDIRENFDNEKFAPSEPHSKYNSGHGAKEFFATNETEHINKSYALAEQKMVKGS